MQMDHIRLYIFRYLFYFKKCCDIFGRINRSSEILDLNQMNSLVKVLFIIFRRLLSHCIGNIHIIGIDKFIC